MSGIRTIMVTTDFSDTSRKAFPLALELAGKYGARVVVAYVEESRLPPMVVEYATVGLEDIVRHQQERANDQLRKLVGEEMGESASKAELRVADGVAHVEIVRLARELHADLIVMATHGRGFFSHAILGSTTERVVRRAPCPVLVVRDRHVE
jgi:nucleotide-binding universal stress UspA family protein